MALRPDVKTTVLLGKTLSLVKLCDCWGRTDFGEGRWLGSRQAVAITPGPDGDGLLSLKLEPVDDLCFAGSCTLNLKWRAKLQSR